MSVLNVENLSFSFGDKPVLKNISFALQKGEHAGLVGINGAGKTTFFNILMGNLVPDEGSVYKSSSINIGYLDQHSEFNKEYSIKDWLKSAFDKLYLIERKMIKISDSMSCTNSDSEKMKKLLNEYGKFQDRLDRSDFYKIDSLIENVARGLGLYQLGMDTSVDKLSGGQRTKLKLAKLLLMNPDLLLLDEPTNYLDKEHIDWLADHLNNYPNSFIVISHDTVFLNNITNVIFNIEFGYLKRYPGNYKKFLMLKDEETKRYTDMYNRQQKEINKMEEFINKNIVRASTTKRAQSRRKQLEKMEKIEKPLKISKPHFNFQEARNSGELVFRCTNMNIGYYYPIIKNLNLKIMRGNKIAVVGCNGIGKSTLLKTIMGIIPPLTGKIDMGNYLYPVYFEQETKSTDYTPLEEIWKDFPQKKQQEIRGVLAQCGLRQEHILQKISSLSGGEQSKVRLCRSMMIPSNWLLLDEPTNHLDADAKNALKEALINYGGTILLVCHEKEFFENWVTDIWNMEKYI